jgi:hypothetical protein
VGEDVEARRELVFSGTTDPDAQDFASFLKDDGSASRIPVLCMTDYGVGSYGSDVWALPHNAIKRELFDMYEIVAAMRQGYLALTLGDVYDFRRWWRLLHIFWRQYVEIERALLDPLVTAVFEADSRQDAYHTRVVPLRDDLEWISFKFEEISGYVDEFELLPRGRALSLICKTTDLLGFKILSVFNNQERYLAPLVESYHPPDMTLATEVKMLAMLRASQFGAESVVHLVRWMHPGRERDRWLAAHLGWADRSSMRKWYRAYDATHGSVVHAFRNMVVARKPRPGGGAHTL